MHLKLRRIDLSQNPQHARCFARFLMMNSQKRELLQLNYNLKYLCIKHSSKPEVRQKPEFSGFRDMSIQVLFLPQRRCLPIGMTLSSKLESLSLPSHATCFAFFCGARNFLLFSVLKKQSDFMRFIIVMVANRQLSV